MNAVQAAKSRHFPKVIGSRREPVSGARFLAVVILDCFQGAETITAPGGGAPPE